MTPCVAIVIPTRNRTDLAIEAVRSLLAIDDPRLGHIIVSNNSSEPEQVRVLAEHCEQSTDARLLHLRPPELSMADHWDWAIEQALARTGATHVGIHYDRRVSYPQIARLFDVVAEWPNLPVTYLLDQLYLRGSRFFVHQMPWSGGLYEVDTTRALHLASRGLLTDLWQDFPVLANCLVPRPTLERVRARFGSICRSLSPESCFGFRLSALTRRYVHFDRPLGVHYGLARSNGMGFLRGDSGGAFGDFVRLTGDRPWLDAAPLPGLSLGQNVFYHEYCLAQRAAGEEKFPPIHMPGYLKDLARGLIWIRDKARQSEARDLLVRQGWREDDARAGNVAPRRRGLREILRDRLQRLRADHWQVRPSDAALVGLKAEAMAVRHAVQYPRPPDPENDSLAPLEPIRLR